MKKRQRGQAVLIVVLVMAIALTIGLAIVSRSITDVTVSRQEEESARAFSAAEAGIERIIAQNLFEGSGSMTLNGQQIEYNVSSTQVGGNGVTEILFPQQLESGEIQSIWLVGHDSDGQLDPSTYYQGTEISFYWGNEGTSDEDSPALEATLVYKDGDDYKISREAFDPYGARGNNFTGTVIAGTEIDGKTLEFGGTMTLPAGIPYLLRLKLLYNEGETHLIGVTADSQLPPQGTCYRSSAVIEGSDIARSIEQCRFYDVPPAIFDYSLYSGGAISK